MFYHFHLHARTLSLWVLHPVSTVLEIHSEGFWIYSTHCASSSKILKNWLDWLIDFWGSVRNWGEVGSLYKRNTMAFKISLQPQFFGVFRRWAFEKWGGFPEICPLDTGKFSICPTNIKIYIENRQANIATGRRYTFKHITPLLAIASTLW